jgi:predicted permease
MILSALVPIFLIILVGFCISRLPIANPSVWAEVEKLVYYIFFPCLLILRLSALEFDWDDIQLVSLVIGLALAVMTVVVVGMRPHIASDWSSLSSVYQGSIRFNTYIGLAVIDVLFGDRGLTAAALCLAVYVPLVNVLSVVSLSMTGESGARRLFMAVGSVASNPLVLACLGGLAISFYNVRFPELALSVLEILSQPALPLGLLAVGAGIQFTAFGSQSWPIGVACFNKLLVFPSLILFAALVFGMPTLLASVLLILTALPSPPSAYILARQLGGNEALMANIITAQTLVAFAVIPVWVELGERLL